MTVASAVGQAIGVGCYCSGPWVAASLCGVGGCAGSPSLPVGPPRLPLKEARLSALSVQPAHNEASAVPSTPPTLGKLPIGVLCTCSPPLPASVIPASGAQPERGCADFCWRTMVSGRPWLSAGAPVVTGSKTAVSAELQPGRELGASDCQLGKLGGGCTNVLACRGGEGGRLPGAIRPNVQVALKTNEAHRVLAVVRCFMLEPDASKRCLSGSEGRGLR